MALNFKQALVGYLTSNPQGDLNGFVQYLEGQAAATSPKAGNGPKRPKAGTLTGKVWDLCDALYGADPKAFTRKAVLEAGRAAGLNDATITTQYQAWKTAQKAAPQAEQAPTMTQEEAAEAMTGTAQ
jgi:hypothetical protein